LTPEQTAHLQNAIRRNSEAELEEFLRVTPLRTQQRHTVEQFPLLSGPDAQSVIAHADRLCLNYAMHKALANLREIHGLLESYGIADQVYVDLTEINNLGYYTGISFEILVPGLGFALGGGGRYDNLVGSFGAPQAAVGVAIGIDRLLNVQRAADAFAAFGSATPSILVASNNSAAALAIISEWRRSGLRVAAAVDSTQGMALWELAKRVGIALAATWTGQGFDLYGADYESTEAPIFVPQEESASVTKWASQAASKPNRDATTQGFAPQNPDDQSTKLDSRLNNKVTNELSEEKYGLRS
jgi:ATP phosphoribosyltransferase regulatory subunit